MSAPDLLRTIVAATRRTMEVRREREPLRALERRAAPASPRGDAFATALASRFEPPPVEADLQARLPPVSDRQVQLPQPRARFNVIAECKRRSPSRGVLVDAYDPVGIAGQYARGGAAAISVLTEPAFFDGALEHLAAVRGAVATPLLRKDFVVDEYQLFEARAAGADAILLIVAALEQDRLVALQQQARDLGLAALVEVHDEGELARAVDADARLIGVNNRNLRTLAVDTDASYRLAALMPRGVVPVSESGLKTRAELERLAAAGYQAFLIGERFMTDPDPARAIAELIGPPEGGPHREPGLAEGGPHHSDDAGAAFRRPGSR